MNVAMLLARVGFALPVHPDAGKQRRIRINRRIAERERMTTQAKLRRCIAGGREASSLIWLSGQMAVARLVPTGS